MSKNRLRIFAGPNGSGKTTLFESFSKRYDTGHFLNSDSIEYELGTKGFMDLSDYNLSLTQHDFDVFCETKRAKSLIAKSQRDGHALQIEIIENVIVDKQKQTHSYEGALISSFLRHHFLKSNVDFSFETVMSHTSKIEEILEAKNNGYKTYLYFVCIDEPEINVSRVENRVEKGGHSVPASKIENRYPETLKNLIKAIEICDKSYLFDNSGVEFILVSKITNNGLSLEIKPEALPNWFLNYVLPYYEK